MIFANVKSIGIPEGNVVAITQGGKALWRKLMPAPGLPAEYQEVEYLQSSGTQYIDTGVQPNQDTRVVVDAHVLSVDGISSNGLHIASTIGDGTFYTLYIANGAVVGSRYGKQNPMTLSSNKPTWNKRQVYDKNKNITTVSGYKITANYEKFQHPYGIYLFARNNAGVMDFGSVSRIYSCKLYNNGTLIRDYVPCCRKSDGKPGMYDLANDVFYVNAGTGEFIVRYTLEDFVPGFVNSSTGALEQNATYPRAISSPLISLEKGKEYLFTSDLSTSETNAGVRVRIFDASGKYALSVTNSNMNNAYMTMTDNASSVYIASEIGMTAKQDCKVRIMFLDSNYVTEAVFGRV
jgi:hypothetical protein